MATCGFSSESELQSEVLLKSFKRIRVVEMVSTLTKILGKFLVYNISLREIRFLHNYHCVWFVLMILFSD